MIQVYRHSNSSTSMSLINYHFVWITRRKTPILKGSITKRLKILFHEKAKELSINILALEIQPDHVHLFVNCLPVLAPYQIIFRLKGFTAKMLRKEFPELMKLPSMWTTSYLVSTLDNISNEIIKKYIEAQGKK